MSPHGCYGRCSELSSLLLRRGRRCRVCWGRRGGCGWNRNGTSATIAGGAGQWDDRGHAEPGNRRPCGLRLPSSAPSGAKAPNFLRSNAALKRRSSTLPSTALRCLCVASNDVPRVVLCCLLATTCHASCFVVASRSPGEDRGTDTALLIRPSASGSRIQKLGLPRPASLFSYVYRSGTGSPLACPPPPAFPSSPY